MYHVEFPNSMLYTKYIQPEMMLIRMLIVRYYCYCVCKVNVLLIYWPSTPNILVFFIVVNVKFTYIRNFTPPTIYG